MATYGERTLNGFTSALFIDGGLCYALHAEARAGTESRQIARGLAAERYRRRVIVQNADLFILPGLYSVLTFCAVRGKPLLLVKKNLERAQEESSLEMIIPLDSLKKLRGSFKSHGYGL